MSPHSTPATDDEPGFGRDPKPYYLAFALLVLLELGRRLFAIETFVPNDFTAYLHAADLFAAGSDPYTPARFEAARYDGFPYNYFPGTLFLIYPLSFLSTSLALALDWIARTMVLGATLAYLHKRILPEQPFPFVILIALGLEPLVVDLLTGNLTTYLLGAVTACLYVADLEPGQRLRPLPIALLIASGLLLSFKPFWFLPAGFVLLAARAYKPLFLCLAAMLGVLGASLLMVETLPHFMSHTQNMRGYYFSVDLLNLAPALLPVGLAIGATGGIMLLRRGQPRQWIWLYGCLSMPVWPRLATYSYILTLPFILFLVRRWGFKRALLYSLPMIGPLPFLLRSAAPLEGYPGELLELISHYLWTSVSAALLFAILWKMEDDPPDRT